MKSMAIGLAVIAATLFGLSLLSILDLWPDTADATLLAEASATGPAPSEAWSGPSAQDAVNVPILVYHNIHPPYFGESEAIRKVTVSPDTFVKEMNYLQTAGYHVISFADLERYLDARIHLPPKPVIISFDDGWEDQFTYALPILRRYRYTATFFIITNYVGHHDFLSWRQVSQLSLAGMTIGSHSRTHPFLDRIQDPIRLEDEVVESKRTIEFHLGIPIYEFAYPYGAFNQAVIASVKKAGYRSARADYFGTWHSRDDEYFLSAMNAAIDAGTIQRRLSSDMAQ